MKTQFEVGEKTTLKEIKPGHFFIYEEELCFKTAYETEEGCMECYVYGTGEFLWGSAENAEQLNNLIVNSVIQK